MFGFIHEYASRIGSAAMSGLRGIGFAGAAVVMAFGSSATAHDCGHRKEASGFSESDIARATVACEIAWMKTENAMIERFAAWQEHLLKVAKENPDEALRQRLPMYECLASPLAPICDAFPFMFVPDAEYRPTEMP